MRLILPSVSLYHVARAIIETQLTNQLAPQWPSEFTVPQYALADPCPAHSIAHVRVKSRKVVKGFYSFYGAIGHVDTGPLYFPAFNTNPDIAYVGNSDICVFVSITVPHLSQSTAVRAMSTPMGISPVQLPLSSVDCALSTCRWRRPSRMGCADLSWLTLSAINTLKLNWSSRRHSSSFL